MSLPSQVNTDKSKHRTPAMKEGVQHTGEVYYGMGPPALKASHGDSASSSGVYNPEKGHQSLPHYQQASSVKWMQDSLQAPGWTQEAPVPAWGQNFGPYVSGVNVRDQMAFHKGVHEGVAMPMGAENQLSAPVEVYRDAAQAQTQGRGLEWEQHTTAAVMHQAQLQAYQHGHKGVDLQGQPHVPAHTMQGPILQPFQASFRPNKPQFSSGYYSVFPANKGMIYGEQPKTQQQLLHQMQQQQMHHHHQQQQQQQHMHQQHHLQLQQQHLQQQQQHQMQQHQIQQQQMQQIQQQYHQQQLQEQQQLQQMQQQMQQNVSQPETTQPQVQPKVQQQAQNFGAYPPPEPLPPDSGAKEDDAQPMEPESEPQTADASPIPDLCSENVATTNPVDCVDSASAAPRRSRRLSREGQSPLGPPPVNMWSQASKEPPPPQNGVTGVPAAKGGESQAATGGVIHTTRRRRRASKEINLETLAQKASEMESLPAKAAKEVAPSNIVPLVIPVSVPVHKNQAESQGGWTQGCAGQVERTAGQADRKPSVIVARRRSLRNSVTESLGQDGESDSGMEEDGKTKFKRRTRPEPLIIPLPKPSTFIPPSVYSSITHYQSNLRSPVRLPDNLHALPPYTPPPILSPVRGGTGLYFTTFLTNIAVSNQILPPPATPKSGTRSLLRSTSSEITPPVLPLITDATPVCLEPRINIGQQYQAEIPNLQDQPSSQMDQHKADLVWHPLTNSNQKHGDEETKHLMNLACSSVFSGGGTNQELVLHCLHECGGNIFETLERLMLQHPIFPKGQHLADYHYSGSDSWTAEEKCYFNKGITAYRKDFFLVQKLVQTKTVAQCVEFYYTYKKQVKVGRNGILTFGPPDSPVENHSEAVVDVKSSHHPKLVQGEAEEEEKKEDPSYDSYESKQQARVAQSLQAHDYVTGTVLVIKEPDPVSKEAHHSSVPHRPRAEAAVKKTKAPTKPPQDPNEVFPCKKCGRVFNKVKSRSAHMKSHAEQEKKAAALRLKEEEEKAAAQARARKLAAAAKAAAHQEREGDRAAQQGEVSSQDDSSEGEDNDDEDWH
ncbi:mitotic deacetylase associated SANT domain protein a isoform X2 [Girardinichthys multiradiatus]|uniref:mitotic deacetylase associated SANT domain protein a isoform X2 n=1 Tax=Girardinichthys multiradiatus TaxID=208333 RepID=UPI001FADAF44|nr:mitotic deacetylase associated SANT domain protein a isoform X2 [Girardinichthys multiradiatus]